MSTAAAQHTLLLSSGLQTFPCLHPCGTEPPPTPSLSTSLPCSLLLSLVLFLGAVALHLGAEDCRRTCTCLRRTRLRKYICWGASRTTLRCFKSTWKTQTSPPTTEAAARYAGRNTAPRASSRSGRSSSQSFSRSITGRTTPQSERPPIRAHSTQPQIRLKGSRVDSTPVTHGRQCFRPR